MAQERRETAMVNQKQQWGRELREIRETAGLSIEKISARLGISKESWEDWENGKGIRECYVTLVRRTVIYWLGTALLLTPREYSDTVESINTIIEKSGLNRNEFAAKYGLQKNTVRNWSQGINTPTNFIVSMFDNFSIWENNYDNFEEMEKSYESRKFDMRSNNFVQEYFTKLNKTIEESGLSPMEFCDKYGVQYTPKNM